MEETIVSIIKDHYETSRSKIFCKFIKEGKYSNITYENLVANSNNYAAHFIDAGIKKGDVVLIILKHCPDLFYSFIGSMMIGAIPSILPFPSEKQDINLYRDSIEKLSKLIGAKSIVTYRENLNEAENIKKHIEMDIITPEDIRKVNSGIKWEKSCYITKNDVAFLQHSSGTTGLKKGVALSHVSVLNQIEKYSKTIGLNKNDIIVSWLPLYHDMGLIACFIMPLIKKIPVVKIDPFEWVNEPSMLLREINDNKGTLCWLPNFAYNFLSSCIDDESEKYDLSSIRAIINCSEPCKLHSHDVFYEKFKSYGITRESLQTCYAMAENVFAITQSELGKIVRADYVDKNYFSEKHIAKKTKNENEESISFLSVGQIIQNTRIKIVDDKRKELPERHVGEIAVSSNSLFSGYFKLEKESKAVLENGWLYTGDMGYFADGELYITGRKKDIIIIHGKNYYMHDIECIANNVHGIKKGRCVAIGVYNDAIGSEEAALIAETSAEDLNEKRKIASNIKLNVNKELNLVISDVYLVPLKWIVKTTSGKISRSENKRKYLREKFGIGEAD